MIYDYIVVGSGFGGSISALRLRDSEKETDPYFDGHGPLRKGCIECGGCMVGCRENAKNTLDKNYLYFAETLGTEVVPEIQVEKIVFTNGRYELETRSTTSLFKKKQAGHYFGIQSRSQNTHLKHNQ